MRGMRGREGLQNVKVVVLNDLTDESDNSHDWEFYLYHAMIQNSPDWHIRYLLYTTVMALRSSLNGSLHS